jgi:PIN domain nuclease of toxin-antitoxin system
VILLDTHIWIWFNTDSTRLPQIVQEQASECAISVISAWELVLLVQAGRLNTGFEPSETAHKWLARYPFKVLDLDFQSANLSRTLPFNHGDPADRFIAATAFRHNAPLATHDARLKSLPWLKIIG